MDEGLASKAATEAGVQMYGTGEGQSVKHSYGGTIKKEAKMSCKKKPKGK
jgi:hypothetical protein